jgi:hypothetical protein
MGESFHGLEEAFASSNRSYDHPKAASKATYHSSTPGNRLFPGANLADTPPNNVAINGNRCSIGIEPV